MYENEAEGEYRSGKSKMKVFQRREVEVAHFNTSDRVSANSRKV